VLILSHANKRGSFEQYESTARLQNTTQFICISLNNNPVLQRDPTRHVVDCKNNRILHWFVEMRGLRAKRSAASVK